MAEVESVVAALVEAPSWDRRVALIRKVPEDFGLALQPQIYSAIAKAVYVPNLAPDFAYVSWRPEYELETVMAAYAKAAEITEDFERVDVEHISAAIQAQPSTLRIFRLLLGLLPQEFAAASLLVGERLTLPALTSSRVKSIEQGRPVSAALARCCAEVVHQSMSGQLFPETGTGLVLKTKKPDTANGWETVREYAKHGVPLPVLLHQRHYGGAFRQLLDSTSSIRGDLLENAVEDLFASHGVAFIRTGSNNQGEIERRFGLTVRPAPDFVMFDRAGALRAILECKGANDGGTARDKAARFRALRQESSRLGGVPLFAVLSGLGWRRTADALGPVVRDTDGRVFMLGNLASLLETSPFPMLQT